MNTIVLTGIPEKVLRYLVYSAEVEIEFWEENTDLTKKECREMVKGYEKFIREVLNQLPPAADYNNVPLA